MNHEEPNPIASHLRRTSLWFCIAVLSCSFAILLLPGFAEAQLASIEGSWNSSITGPFGDERVIFTFHQEGPSWSGSGKYLGQEIKVVDGRVDGVRFSANVVISLGLRLTGKIEGKLDGSRFSGIIVPDLSALPAFPFKGSRSAIPVTPPRPADAATEARIKSILLEAFILFSEGSSESLRTARDKLLQGQTIYAQSGANSQAAEIGRMISVISENLGEYARALDEATESLRLIRAAGDKYAEARIVRDIGVTDLRVGSQIEAERNFREALKFYSSVGDRSEVARTLAALGWVKTAQDHYDEAVKLYREAIKISNEIDDEAYQSTLYEHIGLNQMYLGEFMRAKESLGRALEISRKYDLIESGRSVMFRQAQVSQEEGDYTSSIGILLDWLTNPGASDLGEYQAAAFGHLAYAYTRRDPERATFYGKVAVGMVERLRAGVRRLDTQAQKDFLRRVEIVYRDLAEVLLERGEAVEAVRVLNAFKDQQYFDLDAPDRAEMRQITLAPEEQQFVEKYQNGRVAYLVARQRLSEVRSRIFDRPPTEEEAGKIAKIEGSLNDAHEKLKSLFVESSVSELSAAAPKSGPNGSPSTLELRETAAAMGEGTAAIYILAGGKKLHSVIVTRSTTEIVATPIAYSDLGAKTLAFWRALRAPENDPRPLGKVLYDVLFKPIKAKLPKETRTILWSLDGSLRYVPMAALYDGKHYLVEQYNNVVFTRADKERLTRVRNTKMTGVGMGSSEAHLVDFAGKKFSASALPAIRAELSGIFEWGNSKGGLLGEVLLNNEFTRSAMLSTLKNRRPIVHIASHFKFEPGDEARSFLLLGDGTPFTLDEMKRQNDLFAGVDLLTLSACQTAAQRPDANGREVDGFAELAQRLGAGAVMASLWEVSDNSTAELMSRFYRGYVAGGLNKADAIREAQLALLKGDYRTGQPAKRQLTQADKDVDAIKNNPTKLIPYKPRKNAPYSHPYYWAPFVLIGNWK